MVTLEDHQEGRQESRPESRHLSRVSKIYLLAVVPPPTVVRSLKDLLGF